MSTDLPTALQYFVSNCEVKASDDENEITKVSIFNYYECFNPIFGNAESIFMGRSINDGSTTDYNFSFPAFTFNAVENDQLHMVGLFGFYINRKRFCFGFFSNLSIQTCEITICPADNDCIATSYAAERGTDDDSCENVSSGFKSNTEITPQ